jgi:predicted outer membrane repeat protein
MTGVILLTAISIVTIARAFDNFYNIVPNSEDRYRLCHPDIYCYSFQEIVENHSDYFKSNTVLGLAPGVYSIYKEINLRIDNVTNFVLRASDTAQYGNTNHNKVKISCEPHVVFRMTLSSSTNVTIKDITFSSCVTEDYIFYVLYCFNVSLFNTGFIGNQGAVLVQNSEMEFKGQSVFYNNSAKTYEGFLTIYESSKFVISDEAHFIRNTARSGGALLVYSSTVHINTERITFVRNTAKIGGAIALKNESMLLAIGYYAKKMVFRENKANQYGGAVYANKSRCYLSGKVEFQLNMARSGGAITLKDKSEFHFNIAKSRLLVFNGNNATQYGGAIFIDHSLLYLSGTVHLSNNLANYGGAMGFVKGYVIMNNNTNITISHNYAETYGGGVYVDDDAYYSWEETRCFVSCDDSTCFNSVTKFEANQALSAGSALFGGWIDICLTLSNIGIPHFQYDNESNDLSIVSSYPTRICLCTNSMINETVDYHAELYPGQTLHIQIVAIGQRLGVVPSIVRAKAMNTTESIDQLQTLQDIWKKCTSVKYTIRSPIERETLKLTIDAHQLPRENSILLNTSIFQQLHIHVLLKPCSIGFVFDSIKNECTCHQLLKQNQVICNITTNTIIRKSNQWVSGTPNGTVVVHNNCPNDYCKAEYPYLHLSSSDDQCAFNRSGILCGTCKSGLSSVLGTSNCKKCSNTWLLLILVFALMGIILIASLTILNLTVSTGTINGLIFYANIIRANTATFFPGQSANTFLSWFIAWINLDLGIETCFYDGLNSYAKTWLQFVFPIYIWVLEIIIIASSKYSTIVAKLCRRNSVQVLGTLFLLSYAKLLRVTITIFQPTKLAYSNGFSKTVWHYDGNVDYLKEKHIPLFAVLLIFCVAFAPFTLIIFGIQWLQPYSSYKPLSWINKLKPIIDAYTGPYKDKHRYWTGLLLLVRILLFLLFSVNDILGFSTNLFSIIVTVACIFAYLSSVGGIYSSWPLNVLEHFFLLNLIILSAGTLYMYAISVDNRATVTNLSVGIAFTVFIAIIFYHIVESLATTQWMKALKKTFSKQIHNNIMENQEAELSSVPLHSSVELREPLLI